ncbi:MAG: M20 family metallopeptidase [Acidimicrobiales bacterium]|nr:M20 family metallopeptidase [Acidimicrobiales bacterium]
MTMIDDLRGAGIREEAEAGLEPVIELRRAIHREPELGIANPITIGRVGDALADLPLDVHRGEGDITSLWADLKGETDGPMVLLRADTDALPMTEDTDLEFRSAIDGRAHACGHDAHTAMLVGAARMLAGRRDEIHGTVRFMFQPGEEGMGGAALMIDEGVLDGVDAAYALHITPNCPSGWVAGRAGAIMAAADVFHITVRGAGGHASTPHFTTDPVTIAAHLVTAIQTMVTREIHVFEPAIITVTQLQAGTTTNVIPETATIAGTIRTMAPHTRDQAHLGIERVAHAVAATFDATAEVTIDKGYPVTVNHPGPVELVKNVTEAVLGERKFLELPFPVMGAEDFSYILEKVPGCMSLLGVCPEHIENSLEAPACHSNKMMLHEPAMANGMAVHAATAIAALDELR